MQKVPTAEPLLPRKNAVFIGHTGNTYLPSLSAKQKADYRGSPTNVQFAPERYLGFSELQGPFGLSPGIMSLKPFSPCRTPLAPKFYQGRSSVLLESLLVGQKLRVHALGSILILVT